MNNLFTLQDLVKKAESYNDFIALTWQNGKQLAFRELYKNVETYSKGLLAYGLKKGDRVAFFSSNIPEWIVLSLAINNAGLVDVPRGENSSREEMNYIIEHSKAKIVIVEDETIIDKIKNDKHANLKYVFSIKELKGITNISEIEKKGRESKKELPHIIEDDTASIIYTSGTTGAPKGVELSHKNFISLIMSLRSRLDLGSNDKCLSILPAWHVFERIVKYIALDRCIETFYSTQTTLMDDLEAQKPTIMASVPRVWEVIYDRVMKKIKKSGGLKKNLVSFACNASIEYSKTKNAYSPFKLIKAPLHMFVDKAIYSVLREKLGGRLRYAVSGGSALPRYIDDFFHAANIEILEGYGLTETSPVIAVRVPGEKKLYTSGKILDGIEVKIIDPENGNELAENQEGIVYIKGQNVMKGYYRNFKETKKVLDTDGWLDTGDRGFLQAGSFLKITGREKDIIVLSNGENVNPIPIEFALKSSDYIETAIVTGQDWRQLSALIVPSVENLTQFCKKHSYPHDNSDLAAMLDHFEVKRLFKNEIKRLVNEKTGFKNFEKIQEFRFAKPFSIGKELTLTLKPRRAMIEELYENELESMRCIINRS
jgi:long-chain acyl-CoA synthetase